MRAGFRILMVGWVLVAPGCTAPNVDFSDGGRPPGGADQAAAGSDGGQSLDCDEIRRQVEAGLAAHRQCTRDVDCVAVTTACGLVGGCGDAYANQGWRTADMEQLLQGWAERECGMKPCPCPERPALPPACNEGMCGPRRAGTAPVGAACRADSDCATGQCLTEGEDMSYVDGYCTVKGCGDARPCPRGASCRGLVGGTRICLAECERTESCRKGYGCCSGPGPVRGQWCAPERTFLCLTR